MNLIQSLFTENAFKTTSFEIDFSQKAKFYMGTILSFFGGHIVLLPGRSSLT